MPISIQNPRISSSSVRLEGPVIGGVGAPGGPRLGLGTRGRRWGSGGGRGERAGVVGVHRLKDRPLGGARGIARVVQPHRTGP